MGYFFPYKTDINSTPSLVLEVAISLNISTQEGYFSKFQVLLTNYAKKKIPFPVVASFS